MYTEHMYDIQPEAWCIEPGHGSEENRVLRRNITRIPAPRHNQRRKAGRPFEYAGCFVPLFRAESLRLICRLRLRGATVDFFETDGALDIFADCFIELRFVRGDLLRVIVRRVDEDRGDDDRDVERDEETRPFCAISSDGTRRATTTRTVPNRLCIINLLSGFGRSYSRALTVGRQ